MNLNELAKQIRENIKDYQGELNDGEMIALMHMELSEALREYMGGRNVNEITYHCFTSAPKEVPIALAKCMIRILDYCAYKDKRIYDLLIKQIANELEEILCLCKHYNIDIEKAIEIKIGYNKLKKGEC